MVAGVVDVALVGAVVEGLDTGRGVEFASIPGCQSTQASSSCAPWLAQRAAIRPELVVASIVGSIACASAVSRALRRCARNSVAIWTSCRPGSPPWTRPVAAGPLEEQLVDPQPRHVPYQGRRCRRGR